MEVAKDWLEGILKDDSAERKVMAVGEIRSEPAVAAGENYASSISRVQLGAILGSGKQVKMSLILKKMPEEETQIDFLETHSYFATEIKMYTEILPELAEVLREQGVPPLWPGFLGIRDKVMIFSDLKIKNYKVQCRRSRLDLAHALLAVRTLALFHASSIVLKQRGGLDLQGLKPSYFVRDTSETHRFIGGGVRMAANIIARHWGPKWKDLSARLYKRSYTICKDLTDLSQVDEARLNVLNHGDLWTPNLMFKYSRGVDSPIGVRFIDFQICHYNSYAFDLIFFIACSLPPELRRRCRDQILQSYTKSLHESLRFHGFGHLAPTLEQVKEELARLELFNMACCLSVIPICVASIQGALDFDKLMSDNTEAIPQRPEIYKDYDMETEVATELLAWAEAGLY